MNKIKLMRQAQQLQGKLQKIQQELEKATVEASSGGGAVTVVMTGKQQVQSVKISPEAVDDIEMLQDLVLTAMNEAVKKSKELAADRLGALTGGLKIPGLT
ncbi:MAG: YbaB/EbfC family nucleoid-associated protein [Dehalococcoidia bacterium]|nr:MAG: YbaB/EbfC family nucleoid-associated protein [Dehalococcoidia bacterium]